MSLDARRQACRSLVADAAGLDRELARLGEPIVAETHAIGSQRASQRLGTFLGGRGADDLVIHTKQPRALRRAPRIDCSVVARRQFSTHASAYHGPARRVEFGDGRRQLMAREQRVDLAETPASQPFNRKRLRAIEIGAAISRTVRPASAARLRVAAAATCAVNATAPLRDNRAALP